MKIEITNEVVAAQTQDEVRAQEIVDGIGSDMELQARVNMNPTNQC
jgi:hypothetical protein